MILVSRRSSSISVIFGKLWYVSSPSERLNNMLKESVEAWDSPVVVDFQFLDRFVIFSELFMREANLKFVSVKQYEHSI